MMTTRFMILLGHLDTLITAAQNIVDYGPETAMRVSVRNTGGLGRRFFSRATVMQTAAPDTSSA